MENLAVISTVTEENCLRAAVYNFLATYLITKPNPALLTAGRTLSGNDTELGQAFTEFASLAKTIGSEDVADEYDGLFIGLGRGELLPYASYYLTGFLHEKPLAKLRQDMQRLGIARSEGVWEPEDHIGTLMEMMAGLILGHYGEARPVATQRAFFMTHIEPWAEHFFKDLEQAKLSRFYKPVGTIGRLFIEVEKSAFAMA